MFDWEVERSYVALWGNSPLLLCLFSCWSILLLSPNKHQIIFYICAQPWWHSTTNPQCTWVCTGWEEGLTAGWPCVRHQWSQLSRHSFGTCLHSDPPSIGRVLLPVHPGWCPSFPGLFASLLLTTLDLFPSGFAGGGDCVPCSGVPHTRCLLRGTVRCGAVRPRWRH